MIESIAVYLTGQKLYGDDFSLSEIEKWYWEEEKAYSNLLKKRTSEYVYPYHSMNMFYGYRHIAQVESFANALGFGSAFGHEFLPIIHKIENLTIVEPSKNLKSAKLAHLKLKYVKPNVDGSLSFPDDHLT